jgi:hypothetical protein
LAQAILDPYLFPYKYPNNLFLLTPPMTMEETEFSETSAYKIQKPGNHLKERIQHSVLGESLKSKMKYSSAIFQLHRNGPENKKAGVTDLVHSTTRVFSTPAAVFSLRLPVKRDWTKPPAT